MAEDLDRIIDTIRRLKKEAESEKYDMPGAVSLAVHHPGILAYQIKTQPHYERDMRQASWFDKISNFRDQEVREGRGFPWGDGKFRDAVERRDELKSPYWKRGILAYGQPLRNGSDWMQSFASTNMNVGRMLGGAMFGMPEETEKAASDLQHSGDRLLFGLPSALQGKANPLQIAWEAERDAKGDVPIDNISFLEDRPTTYMGRAKDAVMPRVESLPYEMLSSTGMTQGSDISIPILGDNMLGRAAGLAIDVFTDPVNEAVSAIRALSRGAVRSGLGGLAAEGTLPAVMYGVSERMMMDARKKAEELKKRAR